MNLEIIRISQIGRRYKNAHFALILVFAVAFSRRAMADSNTSQIADANMQFGLDLYKVLANEDKNSNIFLSPFSISTALAMTQLGARGNTSLEMKTVFHWPKQDNSHHDGFNTYLKLLQKEQSHYTLTTANRLFVNQRFKILDQFLQDTNKHYGAKAVNADFAKDGDEEARKINEWVESQTNNKIKDLISGGIDPLTAMIIINAIYFKGNWEQQFDSKNTRQIDFKVKPGTTLKVDMMHMQGKKFNFGFNESLKVNILELPYRNKDLSMFFILPFEDFGLTDLEEKLDHVTLKQLLKKVRSTTVDIKLPKFVLESSFELNKALSVLGMQDAFSEVNADLSGIDGSRELYISQVIHKTYLEVNEEGSEAAAATAVRIMTRSLPIIEPFHADHPFLFAIYDNRTSVLLFLGRLVQPPAAQNSSKNSEL